MNLQGRIAFVTGASQGIGKACALLLAEAGASVALAARNLSNLQCVSKDVQDRGGKALVSGLDVSSRDSIVEGVARALQEFGKIDILVNNAGIARENLAMRLKTEDWELVRATPMMSRPRRV